MKLYYPQRFYHNDHRWHIFPLLKALLKEPGHTHDSFELVITGDEADAILIPMSWNYYLANKQTQTVLNYIHQELGYKKPVLSFVFGDIGCKVPKEFNGIVFRTSGRKSKLPNNHKGIPIFVDDPIKTYYSSFDIIKRPFSTLPVVGFCGQAHGFGIQTLKEISKTLAKNVLTGLGLRHKDSDQIMSTTYFRWILLNQLKKSKKINSNFIIRKKYRAGVTTQKETHPTTLEFYDNIKNSDYVVCMRGAGNFSTRLYETLAMGRIPVFVDTDCLLPLEDIIDWKHHVVWVEYNQRHIIAEKISEFHHTHNEESLNGLFKENRRLWEDYLSLYSFFEKSIL